MSTSLGAVLVSSSTAGYLGSIFTRDAPLVFGLYYAFWVIFALTYYAAEPTNETAFYVPFAALIAAVAGIAIVKLFKIGQLVDVWLSGSGGGPNDRASKHEELNLPLMPLSILFTWASVFFAVAALACGSDSSTCASFLNNIWAVSSWTVGWLLFGVFAALALLAFFASGIQLKRGGRHKATHDYGSIYYSFAFMVMLLAPIALWHVATWTSVTRGLAAGGVAVAVDLLFLLIGYGYERNRDTELDNVGVDKSSRNGRFYSIEESSTARLIFRFATVILLHAGIFVLGGYAIDSTGDDVAAIFWPWLLAYFGAILLFFGGLYVILTMWYDWQDYYFSKGNRTATDEETAQLVRKAKDTKINQARVSPPVSDSGVQSTVVGGPGPIAARTRRRAAASPSNQKSKDDSFDFD